MSRARTSLADAGTTASSRPARTRVGARIRRGAFARVVRDASRRLPREPRRRRDRPRQKRACPALDGGVLLESLVSEHPRELLTAERLAIDAGEDEPAPGIDEAPGPGRQPRRGRGEHQALHPVGREQRELLRDEPAEGKTHHVDRPERELLEEREGVLGELGRRVRMLGRLRAAGAARVEEHQPVGARERVGVGSPRREIEAEAVEEEEGRPGPAGLVVQRCSAAMEAWHAPLDVAGDRTVTVKGRRTGIPRDVAVPPRCGSGARRGGSRSGPR